MQQRLGPVEQGDARDGAFGHGLVEDGFEQGPGHHAVVKDARVVFPIADGAGGAAQIAVAENIDVEAEAPGSDPARAAPRPWCRPRWIPPGPCWHYAFDFARAPAHDLATDNRLTWNIS